MRQQADETAIVDTKTTDLTGCRFGDLTVQALCGVNHRGNAVWKCLCKCGRIKNVANGHLVGHKKIACGECDPNYNSKIEQRLLSKICITNNECWEWGKSRNYGHIRFHGRVRMTHVVAYCLWRGPIEGLCVLHKCDNPPCINPDHLFLGTRTDNNRDRNAKGRQARQYGEANKNAILSLEDVKAVREMYANGLLQREIAAKFGVRQTTISAVVRKETWK